MGKSSLFDEKARLSPQLDNTEASMLPPEFAPEAPMQQKSAGKREENQNEAGNSGPASALPEGVKGQMESSFDADFSDVKVHANSDKAAEAGALAYTQGNEMHFAPGQFKPDSQSGKELIGHELSHVVQQKEGRVAATGEVNGMALNDSPQLEQEADQQGAKAAKGEKAADRPFQMKSATASVSQRKAPIQRFKMRGGDERRYPKFANFVQNELPKKINDPRLVKYLNMYGTNQGDTARDIRKDMQYGSGPELRPYRMKSNNSFRSNQGSDILRVKRQDIQNLEKAQSNERFHELLLESSIMNSYTQFLDDQDGLDLWGKEGAATEKRTYGADLDSVFDAKNVSRPRFGEGDYKVTILGKSAGFAQRVHIFNAVSGGGHFPGIPGSSWDVKGSKSPRWRIEIQHNENGAESVKGWKDSKILCTPEGKGKWLVRSEDWTDGDRNDLRVLIEKKDSNNKGC